MKKIAILIISTLMLVFMVISPVAAAEVVVTDSEAVTYLDNNNFKYDSIYWQAVFENTVRQKILFNDTLRNDNTGMGWGWVFELSETIKFNSLSTNMSSNGIVPDSNVSANAGKGWIFQMPVVIPAGKLMDFDLTVVAANYQGASGLQPLATANFTITVVYDDDSSKLLTNTVDYTIGETFTLDLSSINDVTYGSDYRARRLQFNYTDDKNVKYIIIKVENDVSSYALDYAFYHCALFWLYPLDSTGVDDPSSSPDSGVIDSIGNIGNQIDDLNQSITDVTTSVDEVKDSINDLSQATEDNQQEIADLTTQQDELKQQFDDFNQVMENVEKPTPSEVIVKPSNIMGGNTSGGSGSSSGTTSISIDPEGAAPNGSFEYNSALVTSMFGGLFENEFFLWMLVSTTSLALVGYVLFGKRGA